MFMLVLFTLSGTVSAQVSGYKGKRKVYAAGVKLMPSLFPMDYTKPLIDFTPAYTFKAEYTLSERVAIDAQLSLMTKKVQSTAVDVMDIFVNPNKEHIDLNPYRLNTFGASLACLIWDNGFVAPVGIYNRLSLSYRMSYSHDFLMDQEELINKHFGSGYYQDMSKTGYLLSFQYARGRRYLLNDNYGFDIGVYVDVCFTKYMFNPMKSYDVTQYDNFHSKMFQSYANNFLARSSFLGVYAAFSILK
jgi:hypothetical protein